MKNDQQENGLLRGPLIFMVPASNLIAVLSLDWLDGTNRAAVSAETRGWNYLATLRRTPKDFGEISQIAQSAAFAGGALNERQGAG